MFRKRLLNKLLLSCGVACGAALLLAWADSAGAYTILGGLYGGHGSGHAALNGALVGMGAILLLMVISYFMDVGMFAALLPFVTAPHHAQLEGQQAFAYAPAYAAHIPLKAPGLTPSRSWGGAYVGAHVGYGFGSNQWTDTFGDLAGVPGGKLGVNSEGLIGGVQLGYNWQRGPWVLGVEGEFSGSAINGDVTVNLPPATGTFTSETNWLASVTGRLGYAFASGRGGNSLIYVKGGAAWAEFNHRFVLNGAIGPFVFPEISKTASGWTVGGGFETMLGRSNWSLRAEYMFYDFGSDSYTFSHPVFGPARMDIDQQVHVSKIGVNYRFN